MILCISGSTELFSVALFNKEKILIDKTISFSKKIQKEAIAVIDELLKRNQVELFDLTAIGVDDGPGTFTGLRISVAFAKSFAYSFNLPMYRVSSLDLIKGNAKESNVITALDAKQGRVFIKIFEENNKYSDIKDLPLKDFESILNDDKYKEFQRLGTAFLIKEEYQNMQFLSEKELHYPIIDSFFKALDLEKVDSYRNINPRYYRKTQAEEKCL